MRLRSFLPALLLGLGLLAAPAHTQPASPASPAIAPLPGTPETFRSLAVTRVGHGRPVILIPGLLSGGDVWSATVEHLKGTLRVPRPHPRPASPAGPPCRRRS